MFGFIADILTCIFSILLPIFASYKALRTSDPANLTPWLMYWTTLSLFLLVESQLYFILYWIPFYAWIRLCIHLYLVAPGKQGSVYIYQQYIGPFLEEHERQIDRFISEAHEKAKAAGMGYVNKAIEYARVNVLGGAPKQPSPVPSRNVSYSSSLMSRFSMPAAREGFAAAAAAAVGTGASGTTGDLFSLLGKFTQQQTYPDSTSRSAQAEDMTRSGKLVPDHLSGDERADFVATQRERLATLLQAFDAEDSHPIGLGAQGSPSQPRSRKSYLSPRDYDDPLRRNRSESDFEDLAYET